MHSMEVFKRHQRLAYQSVRWAREQLHEGISEKEAAAFIEKFFTERGHTLFFHRPFAWFGDRTRFQNFQRPALPSKKQPIPHLGTDFLPSERRLERGMAVTLDVAPAIDGLAVDIGYSFAFGDNPAVERARRDLLSLRELILTAARERGPIKELYRKVEEGLLALGYDNCHAVYPLGVLGHRIGRLPLLKLPRLSLMGFHPQAYAYLVKEIVQGPAFMTADETRALTPGLWAVEPHIGAVGFGVKFEEILVVTPTEVYWLDDELPHVSEIVAARS